MSEVYIKSGDAYIDVTGKTFTIDVWTRGYDEYDKKYVTIRANDETIWSKTSALLGVDPKNEYDITEETVKEAHRIVQELIKKMGVVVDL